MSNIIQHDRIFAFTSIEQNNVDQLKQTINTLINQYNITDKIVIFAKDVSAFSGLVYENVKLMFIPEQCDNNAKIKNYVLNIYKEQKFNGFLHILEDNVVFFKDPSEYLNTIESTMAFLDYDIHFSTVTDPCNYLFNKFNPRITLDIDDQKLLDLGISKAISFTSHSNVSYIIYNYGAFKNENNIQLFNEQFSIAMYMIIEFLARRKQLKRKDQLYYMNQYLNVKEEIGVFGTLSGKKDNEINQQQMQAEDAIFKSMNVNYAPDNSIDMVLDALYTKILEKTSQTNV